MMTRPRTLSSRGAFPNAWVAVRMQSTASNTLARVGSTTLPQPTGGKASLEDVAVKPGVGTAESMQPASAFAKRANKFSSTITQRNPADAAGPQSQQEVAEAFEWMSSVREYAPEKRELPQIGISSVWYDGNPCNMHLLSIAEVAKQEVAKLSMLGMRFNSIGVSDGISNGTDGMSYSLQSRDLIADCIETVMASQYYDANLAIPGCDKNMPGCVMAMGRVNRRAATCTCTCTCTPHPHLPLR